MLIVYLLASFITSIIVLIAIRREPIAMLYDIKEYANIEEGRNLKFLVYILLIVNHITTPFLAICYWIYRFITWRKKK